MDVDGDLRGWCAWQFSAESDGTLARFSQEVDVMVPLLQRAPFATRNRPGLGKAMPALRRDFGAVRAASPVAYPMRIGKLTTVAPSWDSTLVVCPFPTMNALDITVKLPVAPTTAVPTTGPVSEPR